MCALEGALFSTAVSILCCLESRPEKACTLYMHEWHTRLADKAGLLARLACRTISKDTTSVCTRDTPARTCAASSVVCSNVPRVHYRARKNPRNVHVKL